MPIDPATIRAVLPKPGGRKAVLVREVPDLTGPRIEVTLADILPGGRGYLAERSIGIGPAIRDGFVAAVESLRSAEPTADATVTHPASTAASAAPPAKDSQP